LRILWYPNSKDPRGKKNDLRCGIPGSRKGQKERFPKGKTEAFGGTAKTGGEGRE